MKAVIFDLDGTLVNSLEDLMDSTNYAMSKVGAKQINIEQTRQYVGNGADMLVKRAESSKGIYCKVRNLQGTKIKLPFPSVGATENCKGCYDY